MRLQCALLTCFGILAGSTPVQLSPAFVDLELVLAVDVSYSMEIDEQRLQRQGYVNAFLQPELFQAIQRAVTYVEWGGSAIQTVPWTLVDGPGAAIQFAEVLRRQPLRDAEQWLARHQAFWRGAVTQLERLFSETDDAAG